MARRRRISMVIHSGGIPKELTAEDFKFLNTKISLVYGIEDEYLNDERMQYETNRVINLTLCICFWID